MYKGLLQVPKRSLTAESKEALLSVLTVINPDYEAKLRFSKWKPSEKDKYIRYYYEDDNYYYVPRNAPKALPFTYEAEFVDLVEGSHADIQFSATLRDYQQEYLDTFSPLIDDNILEVPCGHGKTIMALYMLSLYKRKSLVLVTTNYLAKQWKDRISEFTNVSPLFISVDIKSKLSQEQLINNIITTQIIITTYDMFNTFSDSIVKTIQREVGVVVVDEAHRMGADTYVPIIQKLPAQKRVCLTATFRRADGKDSILQHHFGRVGTMPNKLPRAKVYPFITDCYIDKLVPKSYFFSEEELLKVTEQKGFQLLSSHTDYINYKATYPFKWDDAPIDKRTIKAIKSTEASSVVTSRYDNYLAQDGRRIRLYRNAILKAVNSGRTVLLLSKRKDILKSFYTYFKDICKTAIIISETSKMKPEQASFVENEAQLILGINQLAQEGMDIPRLDTLFFYHHVIDTEQAIGRIQRLCKGKKLPIAFYPQDNCQVYLSTFTKSRKFIAINAELQKPISFNELNNVL